jgi:hypothetical protein
MDAWFFLSFPASLHFSNCGSGGGEEPGGGNVLRLIQIRLATPSLRKSHPLVKLNPASSANRRFKSQKSSQDFIRVHNETLSLAVRVSNPDRSPARIHR